MCGKYTTHLSTYDVKKFTTFTEGKLIFKANSQHMTHSTHIFI